MSGEAGRRYPEPPVPHDRHPECIVPRPTFSRQRDPGPAFSFGDVEDPHRPALVHDHVLAHRVSAPIEQPEMDDRDGSRVGIEILSLFIQHATRTGNIPDTNSISIMDLSGRKASRSGFHGGCHAIPILSWSWKWMNTAPSRCSLFRLTVADPLSSTSKGLVKLPHLVHPVDVRLPDGRKTSRLQSGIRMIPRSAHT